MNNEEFILKLENPQVFTGKEINVIKKKPGKDTIDICLVFPDTYEIGMSHYGIKILYHLLNNMENVTAERCFLPSKAACQTFQNHDRPLFSLESKRPLQEFSLIGFSLLSEMNFTNVLKVLALAQIPLQREHRDDTHPLIAAGGISAANPEPLRDFIDIFAIGDGEVLFPEIIETLRKVKKDKLSKENALEKFDESEGIYVPALSPLHKRGRFYIPEVKMGRKRKPVVKTLEAAASIPGNKIIVPITNVVFNRLTVEIARGCPQNCRFCQAKAYYSPYRAQSVENIMTTIEEGLDKTGFDTFSLSSLSAGDYPWMEKLIPLIPRVITTGTSFSLPSLRPSTLSEELLSTLALFRRTGITIVPEAGSERLRRVINKNVTDEEIFTAVELALRYRWEKIKIYFMIGLPTETMEDIEAIVELIGRIKEKAAAARKRIKIHASFSSFIPKPHTPLQWAPREGLKSINRKIRYLRENLRKSKHLDLDIHVPNKGVVETVLTRGDFRVGQLLSRAYEKGEIFSAWDADFHYDQWWPMIEGTHYEEFLTEIDVEEELPWDFIDINYKKNYLIDEYKKTAEAVATPSCSQMTCSECGGCFYGFKRETVEVGEKGETEIKSAAGSKEEATAQEKQEGKTEEPGNNNKKGVDRWEDRYNKIRLTYEKTGEFAYFSHLSMIKYIERLIRMSGIDFRCSVGFHPRMRLTALPPLPVFAQGLNEVVELFVEKGFGTGLILKMVQEVANTVAFKFKEAGEFNGVRALSRDIHFIDFDIDMAGFRRESDDDNFENIEGMLAETDAITRAGDMMNLRIDYANGGQERFAKIYKTIDPDKSCTRHLTRTGIVYKSQ
ncbi:MAG: TIGR03960 family B12-binding radical SAM protein [bacterium]|nr:TIGR03960 family B12-binding radical SAM protein [bacterium]